MIFKDEIESYRFLMKFYVLIEFNIFINFLISLLKKFIKS